jgi:hypothetical protein
VLGALWVYLTCPGVLAKVAVGRLRTPRTSSLHVPPLLFERPLCEDTSSRSGASSPLQFKKIIQMFIMFPVNMVVRLLTRQSRVFTVTAAPFGAGNAVKSSTSTALLLG